MKRTIACLLALIMATLTLCSCAKEQTETTTQNTETTRAETTTEAPLPANTNLLTGIADLSEGAVGKRPVAVMINNLKASLPQYGISNADIMFEIEVEGGITRMMAIFGDYTKIPNVCSVRSCRYYFPIFAAGFDAVYCCFGSNKSLGTATLTRLNMDYFDGQYYSSLYSRDKDRLQSYSTEHTAYLKGADVPSAMADEGMRSDVKDATPFFSFYDAASPVKEDKVCEKAVLNFSNEYYTTFTYDAESGTYLKQHCGKPHMDTASGNQLAYTNVLILKSTVTSYDGSILRKVDWKGGYGYYLSQGTVKSLNWSKADEMSRIVLTDIDGNPMSINAGKSYIGVLNADEVELDIQTAQTTTAPVQAAG